MTMPQSQQQAYLDMLKMTQQKDAAIAQTVQKPPINNFSGQSVQQPRFLIGNDAPPPNAEIVDWDVNIEEAAPTFMLGPTMEQVKLQQQAQQATAAQAQQQAQQAFLKEQQDNAVLAQQAHQAYLQEEQQNALLAQLRQKQAAELAELERRQEQQALQLAQAQQAMASSLEQQQKTQQRSLLQSQRSASLPQAQNLYQVTLVRGPGPFGTPTGVGIMFTKGRVSAQDPYCFIKFTPGTPAAIAAQQGYLSEGEWLHAVNGTPVHNLVSAQVRDLILGDPNTSVALTISPANAAAPLM